MKALINSRENAYYKMTTFKKIRLSYKNAIKGKKITKNNMEFKSNLQIYLVKLFTQLRNKTYKPGKYTEFIIHEKKTRTIKALPFKDRVVQHVLYDFLYPKYDKIFIDDSYANRINKGIHKGVLRAQEFIKRAGNDSYIIKGDIHHYFDSIDRDILLNIIKKKIRDDDIIWLIEKFLDNSNKTGIPIGNITSQLFANVYLDKLDHYIKDDLGIKFYIRYMDDFVIIVKDKKTAQELLKDIKEFLHEELKLELNQKTKIFPISQGINFLGYVIKKTHIKLRHSTVKNIKRKIKKFIKKFSINKNFDYFNEWLLPRWNSFRGLAIHGNCYNITQKLRKEISKTIYGYIPDEKIKKLCINNENIFKSNFKKNLIQKHESIIDLHKIMSEISENDIISFFDSLHNFRDCFYYIKNEKNRNKLLNVFEDREERERKENNIIRIRHQK